MLVCALIVGALIAAPASAAPNGTVSVLLGATLIDGNGGAPLKNSAVVITGNTITKIAAADDKEIRKLLSAAKAIDVKGKYLIPGLIDTNIHLDLSSELLPLLVYEGMDAYLKAAPATEAAQMALKYGITTIVDTYGALFPLMALRDRIASGQVIGPRLLVAGNIIGWDGVGFATLSDIGADYEKWTAQGTGSELLTMYPDEVTAVVNKYMDLGPDLIKIGVTAHAPMEPQSLMFSLPALKAMVDAAHRRNKIVEVHATSVEGERLSVEAGVDVITHSEMTYANRIRPEFARQVCNSKTFFAIFGQWTLPKYIRLRAGYMTGSLAQKSGLTSSGPGDDPMANSLDQVSPHRQKKDGLEQKVTPPTDSTGVRAAMDDEMFRENQRTLIASGCKIVVGTDSTPWGYREAVHGHKLHADMGTGTVDAIEGLVSLGMSAAAALQAATRNGAQSIGLLDKIGTLEAGKLADLVVLNADPLADISNIRKIDIIVRDGKLLRPGELPVTQKFYRR